MGTLRDATIPIEHIAAELAAAPLASKQSLELALTRFAPDCKEDTGRLWRATEVELARAFPSFSIDEFVALRDWLWFDNASHQRGDGGFSLVSYIRRISLATLEFAGNVFRPRLPPWAEQLPYEMGGAPDARARRFWRWISFALPPDILIAAHDETQVVTAEIELVSPVLSQLLADRGYSEPHVHVGAAMSFDLLWVLAQHAVSERSSLEPDAFRSPGAEVREGRSLVDLLLHGAVIRYVLAAYLRQRQHARFLSISDYLEDMLGPMFDFDTPRETVLGTRPYGQRRGSLGEPWAWDALVGVIGRVAAGWLDDESKRSEVRQLYLYLTQLRERWPTFPQTPHEVLRSDPIAELFPSLGRDLMTAEIAFARTALSYLRMAGKDDNLFSRLFWQTQRVKTQFYRYVVQRPMTPGLQWFVRFYRRIRAGRGSRVGVGMLVYEAARISGMGLGLKSLELRTSPAPTPQDTKELVEAFRAGFEALRFVDRGHAGPGSLVQQERDTTQPAWQERDTIQLARTVARWSDAHQDPMRTEFGLILHFTRERKGGWDEGQPSALGRGSHADPEMPGNLGLRYAEFYQAKRREANSVATLLRRFPRSLVILRGIDVCTDEIGIPTWVLSPLCKHLRRVSRVVSDFLRHEYAENVPPLRMTVHAGEEFTHLLGGLRRVDEAIGHLDLGQGDRIGHGMALGIDPVQWCRRSGAIAVSRIERLFDLAWEWRFATSHGIGLSATRLQYIIDQIERLSSDVFREFALPPQVVRFIDLLTDERFLDCARFPRGMVPDYGEFLGAVRALDIETVHVDGSMREDLDRIDHDVVDRHLGEAQLGRDLAHALHNISRRIDTQSIYGEEPWRLLYRYLTDPRAFRAGQKLILVDPVVEEQSLVDLQVALRKKVGAKGITIEINPSSNLLIGNLSDLDNHPLWRLKPPRGQRELGDISLCIGTDDPITFMSSTRQEYQLVYDTLTGAGLSDNAARAWLDECRRAGLDSRFTLPAGTDLSYERIWELMDVDLSHLREPP